MSLICEKDPTECEFRNNVLLCRLALILKYIGEYGSEEDKEELDKLFVCGISPLYHRINQKVIDAKREKGEY